MKKALLILIALVAMAGLSAFGQTPANGKISLGFGAEGAVRVGVFSNASNFGIAQTLGARFAEGSEMNVDIHVNCSMIYTDPPSTSFLGFGAGHEFGM